MVEKCNFQSKSYLILNIILFCILICSVYYYYYISSRKSKEHFEAPASEPIVKSETGCFPHEQYEMDVDMRECGVYFIDPTKETQCDDYFDYYDMTDVQLDYAIKIAEDKHPELLPKLQEIRTFLQGNGFQKCKIKYDNWKEISSYHDKHYQPETASYVYPKKNVNNADKQINFKLWNSCFAANTNLNKISFNPSVNAACTTPIKNIKDIHAQDNDYVSMSFDPSLNYNDVYKSFCDKQTVDKPLIISSDIIFMVLHCEYKSQEYLKIYDISFVQYVSGKFSSLELTPTVNSAFLNLFRLTYDKNIKRIVYGPRVLDMSSHLINYDVCKNIKNYILRNVNFTFRDYNIPNITTDIVLNTSPELIDKFDEKILDANSDNQTLMLGIINELSGKINNENTQLDTNKSAIETEVSNLVKVMADNMKGTRDKFTKFEQYVSGILQSRKDTDNALYTYLEALKTLKTKIEEEFNKRKALIGSGQNVSSGIFDTYLTSENSKCMGLCGTVNQKLQDEYTKTSDTLIDIYQNVVETIIGIFIKGVYVSVNFYNRGVITKYAPQSERELSCMIMNNSIAENFVSISANRNPYYYENKYMKDASGMQYYLVELSGNILLQAGYYHFYTDLIEEECFDIFIGYPDTDDNKKMIFKNVASYYYTNPSNPSDVRLRKDAALPAAKSNDNRNNTTKLPIYIDGNYNNGYYAFYARSLRGIQTLRNNYLNMKYVKLNTASASYSLFGNEVYEYKAANNLNISVAKNVSDILYYNKEISDMTMISMYYNSTSTPIVIVPAAVSTYVPPPNVVATPVVATPVVVTPMYPTFENESKNLMHWWKFNNTLTDDVKKKTFNITNYYSGRVYDGTYIFTEDTKYGSKSLMITASKKYDDDMFKCSTDISIGKTFSVSLWCKTSACCNKIIGIGDDLFISARKDITVKNTVNNDKNIFYVNGISSNVIVKGQEMRNVCDEVAYSFPSGCMERGSYEFEVWSASGRYTENVNGSRRDMSCGSISSTRLECSEKLIDVPNNVIVNKIEADFNKWNHFVLTYDGSTLKLYYNGAFKHENKNEFFPGIMNLSLFSQQSDNAVSVSYNDLRVYNKALSVSEIQSLFTFVSPSPTVPTPVVPKAATPYVVPVPTEPQRFSNQFPLLYDESSFLSYWWDFDTKLSSRVGNANFNNNSTNPSDFTYDTTTRKYGPSSLKITAKANQDSFKFSTTINVPQTFTWSFWAYTTGCCNKIASIGDDLFINVQKDLENKDIYYINLFSENSTKQQEYDDTCTKEETYKDTCQNCTPTYSYTCTRYYDNGASENWHSGPCEHLEGYSSAIGSLVNQGHNNYFGYVSALQNGNNCSPYTCQKTKSVTYACKKYKTVNTIANTIPCSFNQWNFFTMTYNTTTKTMKFYLNGEFKFEKKNFTYNTGSKTVKLFNSHTSMTTVNYSDMRIHSKELSSYEIYCLYNGIVCSVISPDPGIRKINQRFYITCPKLPTISTLPNKPSMLTFTMLKLPTLLNASTLNYVPIYTQEKTNLDNFYSINTFIEQLDELRQIDVSEFDCMIKAEKQMLVNNVSQESIDNKRAIVQRLSEQITINNAKLTELTRIYNAINTFNRSYDYNNVKQIFKENIIMNANTDTFNKYLPTIFKNLKDGRHYMHLALS
jgi:hypothetical protein